MSTLGNTPRLCHALCKYIHHICGMQSLFSLSLGNTVGLSFFCLLLLWLAWMLLLLLACLSLMRQWRSWKVLAPLNEGLHHVFAKFLKEQSLLNVPLNLFHLWHKKRPQLQPDLPPYQCQSSSFGLFCMSSSTSDHQPLSS